MASCHSLSIIDDQLVGNPLEIAMLKNTGWEIEDHPNAKVLSYIKP